MLAAAGARTKKKGEIMRCPQMEIAQGYLSKLLLFLLKWIDSTRCETFGWELKRTLPLFPNRKQLEWFSFLRLCSLEEFFYTDGTKQTTIKSQPFSRRSMCVAQSESLSKFKVVCHFWNSDFSGWIFYLDALDPSPAASVFWVALEKNSCGVLPN
jgi:hypothetical protein